MQLEVWNMRNMDVKKDKLRGLTYDQILTFLKALKKRTDLKNIKLY